MHDEIELAAEASRRGASGYLLKTCAALELVTAVREVLRGKSYVSQTLCQDEINYLRWSKTELVQPNERLTDRQREVLQLLAEGKVMKVIGVILNTTPSASPCTEDPPVCWLVSRSSAYNRIADAACPFLRDGPQGNRQIPIALEGG